MNNGSEVTMKILLYQKNEKMMRKSGIGRAMKHQIEALNQVGVEYTLNPKEDFDLLHVNTFEPGARRMARKAHKMHKPVVYHAHSTEEDFRNSFVFSNLISPLFKKWIVSTYKLGDYLLTPTPYSKKILEGYHIDRPIQAISNGIDLQRFEYKQEKVDKFKSYFNLKDGEKIVISVGLYFERKGLHDFIEVAKSMPEVKFIWFGHTPLASVTQTIREAIKNKPSNVELPGYIDGDIIEGAFSSADLFFFPSYEETEGIVVLEALASKCQVLVRDIGVYDPWLVDKVNSYKGQTNEEFISLIQGLLNGSVPSTVDAGYQVAQERSIGAIGQQLKEVYKKVLGGSYVD